ncbi:tRNA (guanine(46)-N(7))-methyltransferase TrmB [Candidatus Viridilinea mediisalina]|uniref:tRNA (guanine-N(7)-)-methyltransferase n=1 Tax=Candidatus Viridilinea mediisalina TaxID=2024553 RepID=A0A2A6RFA1_9CHLR|nr:methyltransferase domain-containing protein [Candidatus Viridilinea mediisalina]PDW01559.1 tRNA (guanine-N7)-methyltransferase [Candidatus Viridilinea mediisalina]
MGRGRYPARLRVAPPSADLAARYLRVWPSRELYHNPSAFPLLSSSGLFGNQRPLELDIGCATGDLLLALAAANPEVNYVGIELVAKPLWRAVERAATAQLNNLCFIQADARLACRQIGDKALQTVYIHFPAPLLRKRQRNQLLIGLPILSQLERGLVPGGRLSFMSDQPDLYEQLLSLIPATPQLQLLNPEAWSLPLSNLLKSHYHRRWEARGRPILRAEFIGVMCRNSG